MPTARQFSVAFVSTMAGLPWGGSEELWSQAAMRLTVSGVRVFANVLDWGARESPRIRQLEAVGCAVQRRRAETDNPASIRFRSKERLRKGIAWPRPGQGLRGWNHLLQTVFERLSAPPDSGWLKRVRPDLVVISQGCNIDGRFWALACARQHIPYALLTHGTPEYDLAYTPDTVHLTAQAHTRAAATFFVCRRGIEITERQFGIVLPDACVAWNPVAVSRDNPPAWPSSSQPLQLALVGRFEQIKGQEIALEILRQDCWRQRPVELTFFGEGPARETLAAAIAAHGLTNVRFAGHVPPMEIWKTQHALFLPSRREGLPIVLVEAMLSGRPAIVTDVGGNRELVEEGVTGFLAAEPTVTSVGEALERAWQQRHRWCAMGQLAARRTRELIPEDPAKAFADQLLSLARGWRP